MESKNTEWFKWLDVVRGLAIACVVMCHVVESGIYSLSIEYMQSVGLFSKVFAFVMFSIGRMGVPFFLLISGYLLLDKEYTDDACKKFWKSKCCGLLLVIEFWIIAYNIFLCLFNGYEIRLTGLIKEMLLLKSSPMNHMWYIPMILGMYITIPIVSNALHTLKKNTLLIPCMIVLICFLGIPTVDVFFQTLGVSLGSMVMSSGFSGGVYGLYLVTGYLIKKGFLKNVDTRVLCVCASISFAFTVLMQIYSYNQSIGYNLWYNNLFLFVCGVLCFEMLSRAKDICCEKIFFVIAKYSFAIYLVHNPINMIFTRYSTFITMRPLRVILVWVTTILLSFLLSMLINRIPKIGKMILYMK